MFKIKFGKMVVFGKEVAIINGQNSLYMTEDGVVSHSGDNSRKICTYSAANGVVSEISSLLQKDPLVGAEVVGGRTFETSKPIGNTVMIGQSSLIAIKEGFAFDYNYVNIAYMATTGAGYKYVGGKVCNYPGGISLGTAWSARSPMGVSSIPFWPCQQGAIDEKSNMLRTMFGQPPRMTSILIDSYSWGFSSRSAKKYFFVQRGYGGIYKCGDFQGKDYNG